MNENQDWERRLQELEVEIQENPSSQPAIETEIVEEPDSSDKPQQIEKAISAIRDWFNALPTLGKIIVSVGGVLVGLSILNIVLHLVSSLLSIAVLAVVLYVLYNLFISRRSSHKED